MTRPIHGDFLNDGSSVISDHLRNHVHLTNCIHLKNHMHRHSPILAERSLMRDLLVLQRSRSLRDPSTSPPSWQTPSIADSFNRIHGNDDLSHGRRRSLGLEHPRERSRFSASSPWLPSVSKTKVAGAETSSEQNGKGRGVVAEVARKEGETSTRSAKSDLPSGSKKSQASLDSGKALARHKFASRKSTHGQNTHLRTLSEQLEVQPNIADTESAKLSQNYHRSRHTRQEAIPLDPQASDRGRCSGLSRVKKRNLKAVRRAHGSTDSRDTRVRKDFSVASNSLARGSVHNSYCLGGAVVDEMEVTQASRNGCGIPWNWSRIHHRGKTFLDIAGRSLSCGLSDSKARKSERPITQSQRDKPDMAGVADQSCSSTKSDSDALPLLNDDACGSQGSPKNPFSAHDYSGELGIFKSHNGQDCDVSSDVRTGNNKSRERHHGRHQSLTQKYMPKTFKDLVGQNLVVQALSNAVLRKRVGLIYVFYGPQGTGKSSCARVFARAVICQSLERTKPCGTCSSCISFSLGKSQNVLEVGPVGNFHFESIVGVLENSLLGPLSSQYRVFIVDDCDTLPNDSWSFISRVIDQASRHVVFLLVSTSLDHLPHIITSRCQKFFFPKLKDADIIYRLQWIASKEGLEISKDALKLIASRSDGSLRDAEMTLDQLSLLGQTISLNLVQELVGLVADEKLVDLLDLALSADTVNTVKSLRGIMEAGVEPLALMSQLATIITDILAGSYVFTRERLRKRFFRRPTLSKEEMEKLRQALKTLSESEKQLRMSNDKLTWLTAALLQLAPDQQYMIPKSSADTSFSHSPILLNYSAEGDMLNNNNMRDNIPSSEKGLSGVIRTESHCIKGASNGIHGSKPSDLCTTGMSNFGNPLYPAEINQAYGHNLRKDYMDIEKIWEAVIEQIQMHALKHFMHQEGRLISVSFGAAPTVQLMFSSRSNKSKAEKFRGYILQAFESVLCSGVTLEIRCGTGKGSNSELQIPHNMVGSGNGSSQMIGKQESDSNESALQNAAEGNIRRHSKDKHVKRVGPTPTRHVHAASHEKSKSEIIEILASPTRIQQTVGTTQLGEKGSEHGWEEASCSHHQATVVPTSERRDNDGHPQRKSLVRGKVSLGHVIQQAEGCTQRSGWSRQKAMSIAEKLEQENLRLEPKSRNLLCWKASRYTRRKLLHLRARTKRSHSLLKLISCGRCSCAKTRR